VPPPPAQLLVVDPDPARRRERAEALRARGHVVAEADDAVGAMKLLPTARFDVLVLALDGPPIDLETLARGVVSMAGAGRLEILVLGTTPPLSEQTRALLTLAPQATSVETFVRKCEKLAKRAQRKK
jgi:CheY-like chemotaxis protein